MSEDRKTVDDILAALDSSDKDRITLAKDMTIERVPTPSIGLTRALGGGWAMGREVLIWGPKSAGKTTFSLQQIAILQKLGKTCAYFDVETTYDPEWAKKMGVNDNELIHVDAKSVNHMVDKSVALMQAGVDVIVIDSITPLIPAAYLEKDGESVKHMADMGALGAHARDMSKAMPIIVEENKNTLFIMISQQRMKNYGMAWGPGPTGGTAIEHTPSQTVRLNSTEGDASKIMGETTYGNQIIQKAIGRKVAYTVTKNKLGPEGHTGDYPLMYDGDFVGIDSATEVLREAVMQELVRKAGAWYSMDGKNFAQGEANAAKHIRENKDVYERLVEELGIT